MDSQINTDSTAAHAFTPDEQFVSAVMVCDDLDKTELIELHSLIYDDPSDKIQYREEWTKAILLVLSTKIADQYNNNTPVKKRRPKAKTDEELVEIYSKQSSKQLFASLLNGKINKRESKIAAKVIALRDAQLRDLQQPPIQE